MHLSHRVVTATPIAELWTDREQVIARRVRALTRDQLVALLQDAPVRFVIADVGRPLRWVPIDECYVTWKQDVRPHLVQDPAPPVDLAPFPDGWAYVASEWEGEDIAATPIVVLERHHRAHVDTMELVTPDSRATAMPSTVLPHDRPDGARPVPPPSSA